MKHILELPSNHLERIHSIVSHNISSHAARFSKMELFQWIETSTIAILYFIPIGDFLALLKCIRSQIN